MCTWRTTPKDSTCGFMPLLLPCWEVKSTLFSSKGGTLLGGGARTAEKEPGTPFIRKPACLVQPPCPAISPVPEEGHIHRRQRCKRALRVFAHVSKVRHYQPWSMGT